ncbi:MAG TPA: YdcF family protein [Methyloceanibacter sp.]|nr:YdcF family protein [Methyloceanibacter sp.]
MTEVEPDSSSTFDLLVGGLRLIFNSLMLAFGLLAIGFLIFTRSIERSKPEPERTADGIAVLTGGVARIDEAMKLLAQQKAKRLLITGVNRTTSTEALKQLASEGDQLFSCCVDIDKEARNTIDNATETSQWVAQHHYNSIIVVTSNYHMPRALAELARVMPGVILIPYSVVDNNVHLERWWTYPGTTKLLVSEYLKYLPALGRLGATQLVSKLISGKTTVVGEDPSEP